MKVNITAMGNYPVFSIDPSVSRIGKKKVEAEVTQEELDIIQRAERYTTEAQDILKRIYHENGGLI